eukprot:9090075-Pyramimonas_sp.AAC.1
MPGPRAGPGWPWLRRTSQTLWRRAKVTTGIRVCCLRPPRPARDAKLASGSGSRPETSGDRGCEEKRDTGGP